MICTKCSYNNTNNIRFCTNCGNQLIGKSKNEDGKKQFTQTLLLFFSVLLVIISSYFFAERLSAYDFELVFTSLFALIVLIFMGFDLKSFLKLFQIRVRKKPIVLVLLLAPLFAIVGFFFTLYIAKLFNIPIVNQYIFFSTNFNYPILVGLLFLGLVPALLEEMIFRGLLFNQLLKFTKPKLVIIVTSILFSFVHLAFLSFIWILIAGLILGYFRYRYRTIWYSILFHGLYNSSILLIDYLHVAYF